MAAMWGLLLAMGVPTALPSSKAGLLVANSEKLPRCLVVVDRHNHKSGGTTIRDIYAHQQAAGRCLYWGYGPALPSWEKLMELLSDPLLGSSPLRLCLELHFRVPYYAESVPKLAAIRDRALSAGTCRVVLMTRVREPLAYYLSFWRWAIMGRQLTDRECREKHALGKHAGARVLPETACPDRLHGSSFVEWAASVPNLQSRLLLDAGAATCIEEPSRRNPPPLRLNGPKQSCAAQAANFGAEQQKELFKILDLHDIVGSVEAFDEHLLVLQKLTEWRTADLAYVHNTPCYHHLPPQFKGIALPDSHPLVCPNRTQCAELIQKIAPIDGAVWRRYGLPFRAKVARELGGESVLDTRLAEFKRQRVALAALAQGLANASAEAERLPRGQLQNVASPQRYYPELRVRMSQRSYCRPGKVALAKGQLAERAVATIPPTGDTFCMPVPPKLIQLMQANYARQRPMTHHLPIVELHSQPPSSVRGFARWAQRAGNAQLVRAAGLPSVPPACEASDLIPVDERGRC